MIRLANPEFLGCLLLLIPLLYHLIFQRKKRGGRILFSHIGLLKQIKAQSVLNPRIVLNSFRILVLIFFTLALARPQTGKKFTEINSDGVDIILAMDTSRSMEALDFKIENEPVNRLEIVKKVVRDFIGQRPGDRLGLVVFGEEAFTQCPLTHDQGIVTDFLKQIEIGMAGDATAIGEAIGTAVKRMKDLKAKSKVMILLTDGENTAGRIPPLKAAELAKTFGIKIYTIGVGTRGKAPYLTDTLFGKRFVYHQVNIDEDSLKKIADISGGKYYRATDTQELEKIYGEIDRLEKTEVKVKEYTEYQELYPLFLLIGLGLLLLEVVLNQTILRKIP